MSDLATLQAEALSAIRRRDLAAAEAALAAAAAQDPGAAGTLGALAALRLVQGRREEAAALAERAAAAGPSVEAELVRAQLRLAAGDVAGALAAADATLALAPARAAAHAMRGRALQRAERGEEAIAAYAAAIAREPGHPPWRALLAEALGEALRWPEAETAWRAALAGAAGNATWRARLAGVLAEQGRHGEAEAEARAALVANPDEPLALANLAAILLARGDAADEAADRAARAVARDPRSARAHALHAVALAAAGRMDAARDLLAMDRLLAALHPPVPAGFADRAAFHRALVEGIDADETLTYEPPATTTRAGYQTRNLLRHEDPAFLALRAMIVDAVGHYAAAAHAHPWIAGMGRSVSVYAWATVLASGGRQLAHIHPSAVVSGVYYVRVPPEVDDGARAGWIEFGRPPDTFPIAGEPPTRALRPEEGTMVLFPSWLYHRTFPFESGERRISIAFDVMAA
ncbi:MAG: 2OG-Fe(II) oxygenase family protein [Alphaproteobacteria bacterium]